MWIDGAHTRTGIGVRAFEMTPLNQSFATVRSTFHTHAYAHVCTHAYAQVYTRLYIYALTVAFWRPHVDAETCSPKARGMCIDGAHAASGLGSGQHHVHTVTAHAVSVQ